MTKTAKQLVVGDRIKLADGSVVRVSAVSRGFLRYEGGGGSILIDHSRGWSQVPSSAEVTLA